MSDHGKNTRKPEVQNRRLSAQSGWIDETEIIEIEDTVSNASPSEHRPRLTPKPKSATSTTSSYFVRRQIQRNYANLFLTDWLHEHMRGDNDLPEVVEEWGDYGNLQIIAGKEEYHKNITEADALQVFFDNSPLWRRFLIRYIAFMTVFLILHIIGFFLAIAYVDYPVDPSVCKTQSCLKITSWLNESVNTKVDPCENFYQFVCGNYNNEGSQSEDTFDEEYGLFIMFKSLRTDIQQRLIYGEIFRNTSDSYIFRQVRLLFKSCLNLTARDEIGVTDFVQTLNDIGLHPDNSSTDINTLAFGVWRYTGELGLLVLKLHVNPYNGLRKYQSMYYDASYHKHVMEKGLEAYIFAFQEIVSLMKITKYSAEELARAYQKMLNGIEKAKKAASNGEDISQWEIDQQPFRCDDFLFKLDNDDQMKTINTDNFFVNEFTKNSSNDGSIQEQIKKEGKFQYAQFICNGGLNRVLRDTPDTNFPNIDAKLSYKSYWIMWMFYYYYGALNPALKNRLETGEIFPKAAFAPPAAECLRAIQNTLPHILHERLMKTYRISDKNMAKAERMYHYSKQILESWFNDKEREKNFGRATLQLYREAINYGFRLKNYRFSVSELEKLGYGKSAKKITVNHFLRNMLILRQVLSENEIKKWRQEEGFYLPVAHTNFKYIIKELVTAEINSRPELFHISLMPALLYTNLYSTKDLLPLYYGGIRAYFITDIIYRWTYYVKDRSDITLDPIDLRPCTVFDVNSRSSVTDVKAHRSNFFPYHIVFDVLLEIYQMERKFKTDMGQFFYRKLFAFENYSEEQLVFMKMIRHQCASKIPDSDMNEVLNGLSNSIAFQNAWKCPANSSMNPSVKCYIGKSKLSDGSNAVRLDIERGNKQRRKLVVFQTGLSVEFSKNE